VGDLGRRPVTPRERLIGTATRLLSQHGVHVGLDRITAEAGVALMTVYRHFGGKEGLVAAALHRWSDQWLCRLRRRIDRAGVGSRPPLEELWDALEEWFAAADFSGSLIDDAARELRDTPAHPAHQVIAAHHRATRALLTDLAELAGARDPRGLVLQLELLMEGAVVVALRDRGTAAASARELGNAALAVSRDVGSGQPRVLVVVALRNSRTRRRGLRRDMPATPAG
jgi:AcrR family transcriptional regulator